jgi:hypothetical protein
MSFPSLTPSTRIFSLGNVPQSPQFTIAGQQINYRKGNRRIAQTLNLLFEYITESDMNLIKNHYFNSEGTYNIFFLSAEVWSGYIIPPIPLLCDFAWHYVSAPIINNVTCDKFSVEVNLESIPINFKDLIFDAELAATNPIRDYILEANGAAVAPARNYIIAPTGST